PPAPLPRRTPACATGRLRGPGGRGDLHQRPHAPHAAPRVRATARAHGLRLLPPRVRLALGREPDGRAPAPRPGAPLRPPLRRGSRLRAPARRAAHRRRPDRRPLPGRGLRGAPPPRDRAARRGRVRRRGAGVAQELRLPVRRPALRLRLRGPLQEPGRAAARGPGLPARAAARRRALAAPPERGAGFLGMRRLRRWLSSLLVAMVLMPLALAVGSRTGAVRALERSAVVHFLERATDARVRLGQVGGTLGHSLVLEDLRLAAGGRTVVHVPRLEIVYAPLALLRGVLRLERVTLTAPRVRAVREGGARPFALQPGGGLAVEVDRLEVVDGRVAVALLDTEPPRRFAATALALAARGHVEPRGAELEVTKLRFVPRGLALAPVEAAGRVTASPDGTVRLRGFHLASGQSRLAAEAALDGAGAIDAHLALAPLAATDVRALAPRSGLATDLRARVRMRGPWHALAVAAHADL